ncbi:hypothetical protein SEEOR701_19068 [Salmonella enterica subsp. enterica serovar Oranienburg str. 701]|nr:hypothetical protein SEEOR701_19068 [Salmonella enterica subsp. enterica serovar Oranienburg str. 701]
MALRAGLSPLARGTLNFNLREASGCRFIPAGAGNTSAMRFSAASSSVYPRWRGEHTAGVNDRPDTTGLSPLARGTPRGAFRNMPRARFIPAGAGNTPFQYMIYPSVPVYPRWRGEHTKTIYLF